MTDAILVVAENRATLQRILETLERSGFRCAKVASSATATSLLRQGAVDLVLMDVARPGREGASDPAGRHREATRGCSAIEATAARPWVRVRFGPWRPVV